jgi:hypothetical protein
MDRLGETKMTLRTIIIAAAITAVAVLGTIGSASAGGGGKTRFESTKPHVNVGTIGHVNRKKSSGQTTVIGGIRRDWGQASPTTRQETELMVIVTPYLVRPTN